MFSRSAPPCVYLVSSSEQKAACMFGIQIILTHNRIKSIIMWANVRPCLVFSGTICHPVVVRSGVERQR